MSELPPPEAFESVLDVELPPFVRERRRDSRRTFYAMVLEELDAGRLTRRRRAELLQFGRQIGLDATDVQLLVTGAEFRAGYCPRSGLRAPAATADIAFMASVESPPIAAASLILAGAIFGASFGLIWWILAR